MMLGSMRGRPFGDRPARRDYFSERGSAFTSLPD